MDIIIIESKFMEFECALSLLFLKTNNLTDQSCLKNYKGGKHEEKI